MAVTRQQNWLGNQRVDVPHLRALESGAAGDFDLLAGVMLAGRQALIISGFYVLSTGVTKATNLKIRVKDSSVIHFLASESGSIFHVPADRADEQLNSVNPRVLGSFTPGLVNYIGLDFVRSADESTVDLVEFIDSDTDLETPVQVPLARTLDYRIVISTLDFENNPSVCPIAKVLLDNDNNIDSLTDARQIAFRLGSGGTVPNIANSYSWPAGRKENTVGDVFVGADKAIGDFKSWMDAVMTRLWEACGGEYWYSPTSFQNEKLVRQGSPFVSNGEYFEWDGTHLHWKGLSWVFANSTAEVNVVSDQTTDTAGLTDLEDGECIYVDVDRYNNGATITPAKGVLSFLGTPVIPGSRLVLAWRAGGDVFTRDQSYAIGSAFKSATVSAAGAVKLSASDSAGLSPSYVGTLDSQTFAVRAGGLSRGYFPGGLPSSVVSDFIGGSGDIVIGGGQDGADGHGGGNPVDFNVLIQTSRQQDSILLYGGGNFLAAGVAAVAIGNPNVDSLAQSEAVLLRFAVGSVGGLRSVHHVYGDGSLGFVNIEDANTSASGLPTTPVPTTDFEVRSKLFTRTNGLASPNKRDQLCWLQWDGDVFVIKESNPY